MVRVASDEPKSAYESETFGRNGSFQVDHPVGSASISPCGRDVVLASRQGLHIIDLDSPHAEPRYLPHQTPWDVADVQWSPFAIRDTWIVSTSNQKALLWNLACKDPSSSIEHVLHAHQRAITDINFSWHHPDILATCAVDSFVHCWDIRRPNRPAMSFSDWFAGATQVKWSRQNQHLLASSHDKFLKVWDSRKGAHPLHTVAAHSTKIYGIDWNMLDGSSILTCSLDHSVKVWDLDALQAPQEVIRTPFPVWRARFTPFGNGILALPQRNDSRLHLYCNGEPVHSFGGHQAIVKEFLWRPRGYLTNDVDDREFQLVSWGTDRTLRLHQVTTEVLGQTGYSRPMAVKRNFELVRQGALYRSFRTLPASFDKGVEIPAPPGMTLPIDSAGHDFFLNAPSGHEGDPDASAMLQSIESLESPLGESGTTFAFDAG